MPKRMDSRRKRRPYSLARASFFSPMALPIMIDVALDTPKAMTIESCLHT